MVSEVSAFDEEMKEEEDDESNMEKVVKAEELSQARTETLAQRKEMQQKYQPMAIDLLAARDFFDKVKAAIDDEQTFWESIEIMVDIIVHEYE